MVSLQPCTFQLQTGFDGGAKNPRRPRKRISSRARLTREAVCRCKFIASFTPVGCRVCEFDALPKFLIAGTIDLVTRISSELMLFASIGSLEVDLTIFIAWLELGWRQKCLQAMSLPH